LDCDVLTSPTQAPCEVIDLEQCRRAWSSSLGGVALDVSLERRSEQYICTGITKILHFQLRQNKKQAKPGEI
jgi:hypothetical protein